jgi:uncharacterized protein YjbI with pentapeptide repeats
MTMSQQELVERIRSLDQSGEPAIENEVFRDPIDLSGMEFKVPVRLKRCKFESSVTVRWANFTQGAVFFDCDFSGEADFSWTTFSDLCYFWRSRFAARADFSNCIVKLAEDAYERPSPHLLSGETNFTWARFTREATFYRMQFGGPVWFSRTVFRGDTNFEETKFAASAKFYGAENVVTLADHDVSNPCELKELVKKRILMPDAEGTGYFLFNTIKSKNDLDARLQKSGVTGRIGEELLKVWVEGAVPSFPEDATTLFRSVTFEHPERCEFAESNLENCLFSGTSVKEMKFSNVRWAHQSMFPTGSRYAVQDELVAQTRYESVRQLYHELEANYHESGRYREASDFRYGKMEMLRKAGPAALRNISVLAAYKYLSGYGERYGLALTWLVLFVLVVFPTLYLMLGLQGGAGSAVLHSLEVSTFMEATTTTTSQIAIRVVEGIERLLVPLQAGLFALAVNRRLGQA